MVRWTNREADGQMARQADDGQVIPICQPFYAGNTKVDLFPLIRRVIMSVANAIH